MAYDELGPALHSIEDLPALRAIPGLTVIPPRDPEENAQAPSGGLAARESRGAWSNRTAAGRPAPGSADSYGVSTAS